ncbi:MAG: imidazolonepropionase [Actinomycetota bacterium]
MTSQPSSGAVSTPALYTLAGAAPPRGGPQLSAADPTPDAVLAFEDGRVTYAGPASGWAGEVTERVDGGIVPGFVDCHTHLPFMGWRADEFEVRLAGRSYRDIHGDEGGIYRSARMLAEAGDEAVMEFSEGLAREMLAGGTSALELKTGYGLSVEAELRQARLARTLAERIPQRATVTLLACHAVPPGSTREAWVEEVCRDLLPRAAADGLADAVDVYVEDIAFTVEDLARVAEVATGLGLAVRSHAEQLGHTGAAEAAARAGRRRAARQRAVDAAGIAALATAGTVGVMLPASSAFLRAHRPRVDRLLAGGVPLAVATDCNPGTSPTASMPFTIAVVCFGYGLTPAQALTAATINPAWVLGLHDELGSLEPGKRADFVVLDHAEFRMVPYRPGHDPVRAVHIGGARVTT